MAQPGNSSESETPVGTEAEPAIQERLAGEKEMLESKVSALSHISATHMNAMKERMVLEWKVIFTTIGLFVSFTALDFKQSLSISSTAVWVVMLLLAGISSWYLFFLHHSNLINKKYYKHAEDQLYKVIVHGAKKAVSTPGAAPGWRDVISDREGLSWLFQSSAIFVSSTLCAYLITVFNNPS